MTAAPPRVLREHVVTITRPQPPAIITVAWPTVRVTQDQPPPAPRVIRLTAPPQGPWRVPFPQGHPLRVAQG